MSDRRTYMAEYMRQYRAQGRRTQPKQTQDSELATVLTEDRIRAIVREEIERMLEPLRERLAQLTVNSVNTPTEPSRTPAPRTGEPYPYWKPDPSKPRDPRCQAMNRDGTRCKGRSEMLVKAKDANGEIGECASCRRHGNHEFKTASVGYVTEHTRLGRRAENPDSFTGTAGIPF